MKTITELILAQPTWLVCLILGMLGGLSFMKFEKLPLHGWILYITILIFFWISIALMVKNFF